MKKIISLLMIVLVSVIAYSTTASAQSDDAFPKGRVTAIGNEPNGDGQDVEETNQAGVTALGAGQAQSKTCKDCQTSGNLLLSSKGRRASPGVVQQTGAGTGTTEVDPVGTGN